MRRSNLLMTPIYIAHTRYKSMTLVGAIVLFLIATANNIVAETPNRDCLGLNNTALCSRLEPGLNCFQVQTQVAKPQASPTPQTAWEPAETTVTLPVPSQANTNLSNLSAKVYGRYLSGESHLTRDEFELAAQSLSAVITLSPEFADVRLMRAVIYGKLNQLDQARRDLADFNRLAIDKDQAIQRSLAIAQTFEAAGATAARNKKIDEALVEYTKSLLFAEPSKESSARLLLAIADLLYGRGDYTGAQQYYDKASKLLPQDPNILIRSMVARRPDGDSLQNFTQKDCDALKQLPPTPFSDLVCLAVKKELERLAIPVKVIDPKKIFEEDEVTVKAQITDQPPAPYTKDAREQKISGTIKLSVVLSASGTDVVVVEVLQNLPSPKLVEAAKSSAKQVRFKPATLNSVPVAQRRVLEYQYPPPPPPPSQSPSN